MYFEYGYGIKKNMYVVTRVRDSHSLLKCLPPYVENKTKCPTPVVIEWL